MAKVTTPWGKATIVEELRVDQRAGDKRFSTFVQLLNDEKGGELVRFAYSTDGTSPGGRSRSAAATSSACTLGSRHARGWRRRSASPLASA
jgi:hypothetical protein